MMAALRMETGIAVSEIAVVRQLSRKAKRTTATTPTASISALDVVDRGVDVRLFLDRDDDRRLAHVARVASLRLGGEAHLCDLAQIYGAAAGVSDDGIRQILQLERSAKVAHEELPRILISKAAAFTPNCVSAFSNWSDVTPRVRMAAALGDTRY